MRRRARGYNVKPSFHAKLQKAHCTSFIEPNYRVIFPCSRDPILPDVDVKGWIVTTESDAGTDDSLGSTKVTGMFDATVGVGFEESWHDSMHDFHRNDIPSLYFRAEKAVLQMCRQPTRKLDKSLTAISPVFTAMMQRPESKSMFDLCI